MERNWAGNVEFRAVALRRPGSIDELCATVAAATAAGRPVRALGTRHSFSRVADTDGELLSTTELDRVVAFDPGAPTVTVESGISYGVLGSALHDAGFALANLPSLPHITVGGAVATGTHGSGVDQPCLSAAVVAMELVDPSGHLVRVSRADDPRRFPGSVVMAGRLGVVARLTLQIEPTYDVAQVVYRHVPFAAVAENLDDVMGAADSVSLFTDWQGDEFSQVWCKYRVDPRARPAIPLTLLGAALADRDLHMVESLSAESCTAQLGVPGPWYERLPHFRLEFTPSVGDELQSEYFVGLSDGVAALEAVRAMRSQLEPLLLVSEIRAIAADDLWLSGAYDRDTLAIHFTWTNDEPAVLDVLPTLEAALAPFGARPHWGKLSTMSASDLRARYPRFDDAEALAETRPMG